MNRAARATAGATDFGRLYAELGVGPDCGLAAFKQAYRRRVAGLHPDRPPSAGNRDPEALVALNLGYAAALEFHRGHGRLPGAPAPRPASTAGAPVPDPQASAARPAVGLPAGFASGAPRIRGLRLLTLPVALLVVATWLWLPGSGPPPVTNGMAFDPTPHEPLPSGALAQLGMDRATVAALLGEPVARSSDDSRWIYGPSWVRFECGRLAAWYSSPLRPLRIAERAPATLAGQPRVRRPAPCPPPRLAGGDRVRGDA